MKVLYGTKLVILCLSIMCIPLLMSAQSQSSIAALGPVDTYFVTQTSLGTPFQVDSGNLAVTKGTTQAIREYAQLMVSSHVAVNNALDAIRTIRSGLPGGPPRNAALPQRTTAPKAWPAQSPILDGQWRPPPRRIGMLSGSIPQPHLARR
jgi:predicted outer membrane protein